MPILAIVVLALSCLLTACNRPAQNGISAEAAEAAATGGSAAVGKTMTSAGGDAQTADAADQDRNTRQAPNDEARPAAERQFTEVTLPAGTVLPLVLDTPVASDSSRVEQAVRAHLARPVRADGVVVLPTGSELHGVVTNVVRSGKVKGRAHIALDFESLTRAGDQERYRIATASVGRTAPATKKEDTLKVVAPAAGGAIIGRIAGGRKGAAIGTAVGAGAGGAVVMSTRGKEVRLGKGALLSVRLSEPLTVRIPRS